ncbi:AzlD domain-containing protein [Pseudotabrizicola sp. L79]|uniref:AzlD domain-containing protein n=1 Tax=Pseudotabrizicola sp. L79 TaxID=3118402 RepID=UPI002F94C3F9
MFWTVVPALAVGTFLIRFSFLGMLGNRPLPAALRRALRYTAVAILPGLVAPAVLWPAATGGQTDLPRLAAACVTLLVGIATRSVIGAILAGGVTLYTLLWM